MSRKPILWFQIVKQTLSNLAAQDIIGDFIPTNTNYLKYVIRLVCGDYQINLFLPKEGLPSQKLCCVCIVVDTSWPIMGNEDI